MSRVRVVHWKVLEAAPLVEACRACGLEVEYDDVKFSALAKLIRQQPPDALVIDLTRLPSYGREAAIYLRRTKYGRHIPLIFVDGARDKVDAVREQLPDATFATRRNVCARIESACAEQVRNPVIPPGPKDRYTSRTVAQKLGIKENSAVAVIDPPRNYASVIGELPAGAELLEDPASIQAVTLWFAGDERMYRAGLRRVAAIADRTKLWVLWRKSSGVKTNPAGLTDKVVRAAAIDHGLVDYKICAVNEQWSGMAFARRKP